MIENWSKEMDDFIKVRQFQNVRKTMTEFRDTFHVFLGEKELNRRYFKLYKKKNKNSKLKVRASSFLARGIRYQYTCTQYCGGYVGALRKSPYMIHFAEDAITLKVELRAIMLRYLKDMDLLLDGKLCPLIRIDWIDTNLSMKAIAKKYGVTRDTVYGVILGDIHPDPQYLRYEMKRVRKIRVMKIHIFEGEEPRGYREWAADPRSNVGWGAIYYRYKKGIRGPDLLKPYAEKLYEKYYLLEGEYKTIREWLEDPRCEVSYNCLRKRIRLGWEINMKILKQNPNWRPPRFSYKDKESIPPQKVIRQGKNIISRDNKDMPKIH